MVDQQQPRRDIRPGINAMARSEVNRVLECVIDSIYEIDQECDTPCNGMEYGLVNVKLQFGGCARKEVGKKLTEETLIACLAGKKLAEAGWTADREFPYPEQRRKKCDLVFQLNAGGRLWLELKLAWKAWVNCSAPPTYSNRSYLPYLRGMNHDHSFRGDFDKLSAAKLPPTDYRAVCLVGFDYVHDPMDKEVAAVVRESCGIHRRWRLGSHKSWDERRGTDFRINAWAWLLCPARSRLANG
jgi:hypothetical protein